METFADEDVVTFEDVGSFVVRVEGRELYIVDYFHEFAVVWQVLVSSSANKLVLVVERLLVCQ